MSFRIRTRHLIRCTVAVFLLSGISVSAQFIDQSQTTISQFDDIGSKSGQTFTAGINASLTAVRLRVAAHSNGSIFGSDFVLSLRSTLSGTPTNTILASGNFSRSVLQPNVPQWVTVDFGTPYQQIAGQRLAFTIQELSGGGVNGYNTYGNTPTNPYTNGQMFFDFTPGQPLASSSSDFAFQTVVLPEPASLSLLAGGIALIFGFLSRPRVCKPHGC